MPFFSAWSLSDLTITGPDPFDSDSTANSSAVGVSTITVNPGEESQLINLFDNDATFEDGDTGQTLQQAISFNGESFSVGEVMHIEYSYVLRPVGSSDPADNITIYAVEMDGDVEGFAADGQLVAGVTYDVVAIDTVTFPTVNYSSMYVCFGDGTRIKTPCGARAVEDLVAGDLVETCDFGPQPLIWVGRRTLRFRRLNHPQKPIRINAHSLGAQVPNRDLVLSPQHRVLVKAPDLGTGDAPNEALAAATHLEARGGIRKLRGAAEVTYHSLLCAKHVLLMANGAWVESFYPGPVGMSLLSPAERTAVHAALGQPENAPLAYGPYVRPVLPGHQAKAIAKSVRAPEGNLAAV